MLTRNPSSVSVAHRYLSPSRPKPSRNIDFRILRFLEFISLMGENHPGILIFEILWFLDGFRGFRGCWSRIRGPFPLIMFIHLPNGEIHPEILIFEFISLMGQNHPGILIFEILWFLDGFIGFRGCWSRFRGPFPWIMFIYLPNGQNHTEILIFEFLRFLEFICLMG